jgi:Flp pilus assembly pilin Flp
MTEYAVVLGLITLAIVVTIAALSGALVNIFDSAAAVFG